MLEIIWEGSGRSVLRVCSRLLCAVVLLSGRSLGEETHEAEPAAPVRIAHDEAGNSVLTVNAETRERIELATAPLSEATLEPTVRAYGALEEDPGQSFTLRSPVAGYLRSSEGHVWPSLGDRVEDGATIASVELRLSPTESLDLLTRWMEARAEVDELAAEVVAARSSYENKKRLNVEGKLVSDRSMEEAEVKLKGSAARLAAVKERVDAMEHVMPGQGVPQRIPLVVRGGEVVEVAARPDEAVESGQALLRVAPFHVLIVRATIPGGSRAPTPLPRARVFIVGQEDRVLRGEPMGRAPSSVATIRGDTTLFRVAVPEDTPLRPGTAVIVDIPTGDAGAVGTIVPRSAVLRYGGVAWVYVAASDTQFVRTAIALVSPLESGWFVSSGVAPGESVVTDGAQSLLSEELKAQIEREESAEE